MKFSVTESHCATKLREKAGKCTGSNVGFNLVFFSFSRTFLFLVFCRFQDGNFQHLKTWKFFFRDKYEQRRNIKMSVYNNYIFWDTFIRYEFILHIITSVFIPLHSSGFEPQYCPLEDGCNVPYIIWLLSTNGL